MLNRIAALSDEEKTRGIVTWSAGNAAQGAAFAAATEAIPCRSLHVGSANPLKVAATRGYGADVDLTAGNPARRRTVPARVCGGDRTHLRAPVRRSDTQAGRSSIGLEVVEDTPDVAAFVVPVGGEGLIAGVASAVDCRVVGVEPERAPSLSAALAAGEPVRIEPSSVADGLNAPFTGASTLDVCRARVDDVVLVTEDEIAEECGSSICGPSLRARPAGQPRSPLCSPERSSWKPGPVVAVVSGGNADLRRSRLVSWPADEDRASIPTTSSRT